MAQGDDPPSERASLTNEELAYIAGFFDGEGSITIHHNCKPSPRGKNPNHTLQVSIGNTDPSVVEWIHRHFGGNLAYRTETRANHRSTVQWFARAKIGADFLIWIIPFLRMKRAQAEIAIEFQMSKSGGYRKKQLSDIEVSIREGQREQIRALNRRHHLPVGISS